jgi:aldose 1-epimerase
MLQDAVGVEKTPFGTLRDGSPIELYTLRTRRLEVSVTTFGGRIIDLKMCSERTAATSVVLGFDSLLPYLVDRAYLGALIGRYANRIANARFNMNATTYHLSKNEGDHSLHGGRRGFDQRVWSARMGSGSLTLNYTSEAGEEGYPGELRVAVKYTVADNELQLLYEATTTANTPVNLTSHLYFNLSGYPRSTVLDHIVTLHADQFTPVDHSLIPTGELRDVAGTPFDFREPRVIGERIDSADPQLLIGQGYDHNWVLRGAGSMSLAAEVYEPKSGRRLEVLTTEPGLQFYTGNQLSGPSDSPHSRRCGLCLETQHFPDSPNHSNFPAAILGAGKVYRSQTTYRFFTGS